MSLAVIVGTIAAIAGTGGIGAGIHGGVKMKQSSDTVKAAQKRNEENVEKLEIENKKTMQIMDSLGTHEMEIISSFERLLGSVFTPRPSTSLFSKSFSMIIDIVLLPFTVKCFFMLFTVPDTLLCIGAEIRPSASAIICPLST